MGASIIALRHSCPSGGVMRMPMPRTRTIASAAFGFGVARLKRPSTGYWPRSKTVALESVEPSPLASNVPVKQMPLAWLRRYPSAGPPGGASAATSFFGVSRCGESHPDVYAKAPAATTTTVAMINRGLSRKVPGDVVGSDIQTSAHFYLQFTDDKAPKTSYQCTPSVLCSRATARIYPRL